MGGKFFHVLTFLGVFLVAIFAVTLADREKRDESLDKTWEALKQVWSGLSEFFANHVQKMQDLFASQKVELQAKVDETAGFLKMVKDNAAQMADAAKAKGETATATALQNVNSWYDGVIDYQSKLKTQVSDNVDELSDEWKKKVTTMYDGGLEKVIEMAKSLKNDAALVTSTAFSVVLSILTVAFLMN